MLDLLLSRAVTRKCVRCGEASWRGTCAACRTLPPTLFRTPQDYPVRALGTYHGPTGDYVRRLKYQDETIWAAYLGAGLKYLLPTEWLEAVIVPVPLHPERLAE